MSLLYIILICNSGGACTQANPSTFDTPQACLHELPRLYEGEVRSMRSNGKFYLRDDKDSWLECIGAREDDGRIIQPPVR